MTAPTPEQMRALADEAWRTADGLVDTDPIALRELSYRQATTLHAAADQLEAVQAVVADVGEQRDYWAERLAAVERVADMAQDDEDGNGWVPVSPLLDALYPEKRGVNHD